jgi:hypothetical protein
MNPCSATQTVAGKPFVCVLDPHPDKPDHHYFRRAAEVNLERAANLMRRDSPFHREVATLLDLARANTLALTSIVPRQLEEIARVYLEEQTT